MITRDKEIEKKGLILQARKRKIILLSKYYYE